MSAVAIPSEVLAAYGLEGLSPHPLGQGRINDTFQLDGRVLQRLNEDVFPHGDRVMANLQTVLNHLAQKGATPLRLVPTRTGNPFLRDGRGHLWRVFNHVPNARTVEGRATPGEAEAVARAFGAYLRALSDLPASALQVVIPGFHDTRARLNVFEAARRRDPLARAGALAALDPVLARLRIHAGALQDAGVPLRNAHDDTKLNNVLLDEITGQGVCVLDLDTTQPGSWLADFGDMARSACNPAGEEGPLKETPKPDLATFAALAKGFLGELGPVLVPAERARLAMAPVVISFELGLRFLTDHLEGDRIFAVDQPGDNLRRGAGQWALAEGFLASQAEMQAVIDQALSS